MLDGQPYYGLVDGGGALRFLPTDDIAVTVLGDLSFTDYAGGFSPNFSADNLASLQLRGGVEGEGSFGDTSWGPFVSVAGANAAVEAKSYLSVRGGAAVYQPLEAVGEVLGLPLSVRLGAYGDHVAFSAADPALDLTRKRPDTWVGGEAALVLGLTDDLELEIGADYGRRFSNIAAFDTETVRAYSQICHDL